jgi:Rrf2 family protein
VQISRKFTTAVHTLLCISVFSKDQKVTSEFIAGSTGVNPVIIRRILLLLKAAGMIEVTAGTGGAQLIKKPDTITLYDIYSATETERKQLFGFHDNPSMKCPVGKNIHAVLDQRLVVAQQAFETNLRGVMLSDLLDDLQNLLACKK